MQSARDEHVPVALQPDVDGADLQLLLRVHDPDDVALAERGARDRRRVLEGKEGELDPCVAAEQRRGLRAHGVQRAGHLHAQPGHAARAVDLAEQAGAPAGPRRRAVGEMHRGRAPRTLQPGEPRLRDAHLDREHRGVHERREVGAEVDGRADLDALRGDERVEGRQDPRALEVEAGLVEARARGPDVRLAAPQERLAQGQGLRVLVRLEALREQLPLLRRHGRVPALDLEVRLGGLDRRLGRANGELEVPRIDLEDRLAGGDAPAHDERGVQRDDGAGHVGADRERAQRLDRAERLQGRRVTLERGGDDVHGEDSRRTLALGGAAGSRSGAGRRTRRPR